MCQELSSILDNERTIEKLEKLSSLDKKYINNINVPVTINIMTCKNRYMYVTDNEVKQPKYTMKGFKS